MYMYVCMYVCINVCSNMDGSTGASTIVVGGVRSVQVSLEVMNLGEDAFRAAVFVTFPPQLEFSRASGTFNNGVSSKS